MNSESDTDEKSTEDIERSIAARVANLQGKNFEDLVYFIYRVDQ